MSQRIGPSSQAESLTPSASPGRSSRASEISHLSTGSILSPRFSAGSPPLSERSISPLNSISPLDSPASDLSDNESDSITLNVGTDFPEEAFGVEFGPNPTEKTSPKLIREIPTTSFEYTALNGKRFAISIMFDNKEAQFTHSDWAKFCPLYKEMTTGIEITGNEAVFDFNPSAQEGQQVTFTGAKLSAGVDQSIKSAKLLESYLSFTSDYQSILSKLSENSDSKPEDGKGSSSETHSPSSRRPSSSSSISDSDSNSVHARSPIDPSNLPKIARFVLRPMIPTESSNNPTPPPRPTGPRPTFPQNPGPRPTFPQTRFPQNSATPKETPPKLPPSPPANPVAPSEPITDEQEDPLSFVGNNEPTTIDFDEDDKNPNVNISLVGFRARLARSRLEKTNIPLLDLGNRTSKIASFLLNPVPAAIPQPAVANKTTPLLLSGKNQTQHQVESLPPPISTQSAPAPANKQQISVQAVIDPPKPKLVALDIIAELKAIAEKSNKKSVILHFIDKGREVPFTYATDLDGYGPNSEFAGFEIPKEIENSKDQPLLIVPVGSRALSESAKNLISCFVINLRAKKVLFIDPFGRPLKDDANIFLHQTFRYIITKYLKGKCDPDDKRLNNPNFLSSLNFEVIDVVPRQKITSKLTAEDTKIICADYIKNILSDQGSEFMEAFKTLNLEPKTKNDIISSLARIKETNEVDE